MILLPAVFLFLAACMVACSSDDGPNGPDVDKTPPVVVYTSPVDNATDVPIDAVIRATFSEPIDTTTIASSTFMMDHGVSGSFSFDSNTVTLTPSNLLAYDTVYTVTITTDVADTVGNRLAEACSWSFRTEGNPATVPPVVVSTSPVNGAVNVDATAPVTATFSKEMNTTTLTSASFYLDKGVTGVVTCSGKMAAFTPDDTLEYSTKYATTITVDVADTFGLHPTEEYAWAFTTGPDPMIPIVYITSPPDSAIVGEGVTISVSTSHPVGVERVEIFIDGVHVTSADDSTAPFQYTWDASGSEIATTHTVVARAYDSSGRVGISNTVNMIYQWLELATDINDEPNWPTDIARILTRSTDTLLEFRYEFFGNWADPCNDTGLFLGIYLDTDQSQLTGRTDFDGITLNDIGAECRVIIGLYGNEAFAVWNTQKLEWEVQYDPSGFAYLNLPPDTNVLEFGINWTDLSNPWAANMISINVFFLDQNSYLPDWVPDHGSGHLTVRREDRYVGEGFSGDPQPANSRTHSEPAIIRYNPFSAR